MFRKKTQQNRTVGLFYGACGLLTQGFHFMHPVDRSTKLLLYVPSLGVSY